MEKELKGQLSTDEIAVLKKKLKVETIIEVPFKDSVIYLKEPDRNATDHALTEAQRGPLAMVESIIENCFVGGDSEIIENTKFKVSLMGKTDEILGISSIKLKNL